MSLAGQNSEALTRKDRYFETTHWSEVFLAGRAESPDAEAALASLYQTYWFPLYVYIRRLGHSPEDAEDLAQGFFARVLEKNYFKDADRNKGKFRTFLLTALKRFMANEWDHANRQKRGGGRKIISLNEENTETRYLAEPADQISPEKAFERQWATILLGQVLDQLEAEFSAADKAKVFNELKIFLTGEKSESSYAEIGQRLGMSEATIKVTVHRLRQRYRDILRLQIANTVDGPEAVDDEIRHLFAALS